MPLPFCGWHLLQATLSSHKQLQSQGHLCLFLLSKWTLWAAACQEWKTLPGIIEFLPWGSRVLLSLFQFSQKESLLPRQAVSSVYEVPTHPRLSFRGQKSVGTQKTFSFMQKYLGFQHCSLQELLSDFQSTEQCELFCLSLFASKTHHSNQTLYL